jgi:hypothetical protein
MEHRPEYWLYTPPEGTEQHRPANQKYTMTVLDGRAARLSLDGHGFELVPHESAVKDFYDNDEVREVYYPEVGELIKKSTGATRVLTFDHNQRHGAKDEYDSKGVSQPVRFAHNDYTEKSGPQRVRDLAPDDADDLLQHRFAVINVWRAIGPPIEATPLGVLDADSLETADFVPTDLKYRDRTGEVYSITHRAEHRWYYFPRMHRDEALLLKCFDSSQDGRARFTAHSAFDDPTTPESAPPRESIEARSLVFFAPDA